MLSIRRCGEPFEAPGTSVDQVLHLWSRRSLDMDDNNLHGVSAQRNRAVDLRVRKFLQETLESRARPVAYDWGRRAPQRHAGGVMKKCGRCVLPNN